MHDFKYIFIGSILIIVLYMEVICYKLPFKLHIGQLLLVVYLYNLRIIFLKEY